MAQEVASLYARIGANLTGLETGLNSAKAKLQSAGSAFRKVGTGLTMGITAPLVALGFKAASTAADFEAQMNVLSMAARSSGTAMNELQDAAIAVGGDTRLVGIDAAQAAESMTELYKAGLTTTDIFGDMNAYMSEGAELSGVLRGAVDLQAASELSLAQASDVLTVSMSTFGLSADDASDIANNFVQAADASVASVSELADALVNVGPTAAAFGYSLEDTNTALALLSSRGIKGAEAGTALKSMLTNIMRPTSKVTEALGDLNVSLYDQEGALKDLPDIIGELGGALDGLSEKQRNEYIQTLAGTYGMKAMNTLLAEGVDGWEDMEGAIDSASSVQDSAAARTQGFSAAMENLQGTLETLQIKAFTPLLRDVLTPFLKDHIIPLAEKITELDPKFIKWGIAIAGVAAAAGPLMIVLGAALSVAGALVSPIGLVVAGVAALAAVFVNSQGGIEGAWTKLQGFADSIATFVQPTIQQLVEWYTANLPLIKQTTETVLGALSALWTTVWPYLETVLGTAWENIKTLTSTSLTALLGIIKTIMLVINGDWAAAWEEVKTVGATIWTGIQAMFKTTFNALLGFFGTNLDQLIETVKTKWETMKLETRMKLYEIRDAILGFKSQFLEAGKGLIEGVKEGIKAKYAELKNSAVSALQSALQSVRDKFNIHSPMGAAEPLGEAFSQGIAQGIMAGLPTLLSTATGAMSSVLDTAQPGNLIGEGGVRPSIGSSWLMPEKSSQNSRGDEVEHRLTLNIVTDAGEQEISFVLGAAEAENQALWITAAHNRAVV